MKIEAIYHDGRLQFTQPVHLKAGPVRLLIDVPPDVLAQAAGAAPAASTDDDAAQTSSEPYAPRRQQLPTDVIARLEHRRLVRAEILGRPPTSEPESALTEEQRQRDRAFAERQAWRAEQGRV